MRVIGLKELKISKLTLPGDWAKTMADPSVEARAISIEDVGLIHEPVVRESDLKLGPGRRRVAAHLKLGKKSVLCKLVDCTDEELELMILAENAEREHDPSRQRTASVELVAKLAAHKAAEGFPVITGGPGRGKTAKGIAREEVAKRIGIQPNSLRMREYREQKAKETGRPEPSDVPKAAEKPPLEGDWVELEEQYCFDVAMVQEGIDEASNHIVQAVRGLTVLKSRLPVHGDRFDRLHDELSQAGSAIRGLRPKMICPWCKGIGEIQPKCVPCRATGYITDDQVTGVPAELMSREKPVVIHLGKQKPMLDYFPDEPVPEAHPVHIVATGSFVHEVRTDVLPDDLPDNPFGLDE